MSSTLKQQTISGMFWTVGERLSMQAVGLVVSIILARLLEPSEFGLISMLTIFTAVSQTILDSGFGAALIQKQELDQVDTSSVFFLNLVLGILLAGLLTLAAPLIAQFFNQPLLVSITRVLSLGLIINAFSLVPTALITKSLNFKMHMRISVSATIISGAIGIVMALLGYGVWSLVAQILSRSLFQMLLLWFLNPWCPSLAFSIGALSSMFSFGSKLLVSSLLHTTFRNLYETFIGRFFSAADLGFYSKALTIETAATQATSTTLSKVLFPALSTIQNDIKSLRKAYRKTIRLSLFLHFPLMIGLWAAADPIIRLLLTDKWAASIPYFQIMCIIGLLYPVNVLNLNILQVKGRSDLFLRLEIIKKVSIIIAIIISFRWGIIGLLYGQLLTTVLEFFLNSYYSQELIEYSQIEQVLDFLPSLIYAILMGAVMWWMGRMPIGSNIWMLIAQSFCGIFIYSLVHWVKKSEEMFEIIAIVTSFMRELLNKIKGVIRS